MACAAITNHQPTKLLREFFYACLQMVLTQISFVILLNLIINYVRNIMQELKSYVSREERVSGLSPLDAKKGVALSLGVGIATLYRWLKSGDYYIQLLHGGTEDGEGAGLAVYKLEKIVE